MPRVLFVKTSSLGDVIHHCPAVTDAARALPGIEIDWVVEETFAAVARMHPAVRRVLPVAVRRWRRRPWTPAVWREVGGYREAVGTARYDAVVDSQGLLKSALLARAARGPRHGYDTASAREPIAALLYDHRHRVPRAGHAVERNRALAGAALGYRPEGAPDYGLQAAHAARGERPYAVLLTMTSRDAKLWPEPSWAALADELGRRGMRCVLPWGTPDERMRCERIARYGAGRDLEIPARMALEDMAVLLARARLVVGVDTGLTHFAAALAVPALGIYCRTDPARTGLHAAGRVANVGGPGDVPGVSDTIRALEALAA